MGGCAGANQPRKEEGLPTKTENPEKDSLHTNSG